MEGLCTQNTRGNSGRAGGIRTHDLFVPNEALYQAEPQPAFVIADSCGPAFGIAAIQRAGRDL